MARSQTTLRVPIGTTDEQLIEVLEKVLPDLLVKKMNLSPVRSKQAAGEMARAIVSHARQCSETHLVGEVTRNIPLKSPSQEQCEAFKEALDEIIVIEYVKHAPRKTSLVRWSAGKLWSLLKHDVLGMPMTGDTGGPTAGGVRG
jgi:hypothetical protein